MHDRTPSASVECASHPVLPETRALKKRYSRVHDVTSMRYAKWSLVFVAFVHNDMILLECPLWSYDKL